MFRSLNTLVYSMYEYINNNRFIIAYTLLYTIYFLTRNVRSCDCRWYARSSAIRDTPNVSYFILIEAEFFSLRRARARET